MSKCPHCGRRLEWPVRVDPHTGVRVQLPPCDAEPAWAVADPDAPEIGFEPRRLEPFRGRVLALDEIAAHYWKAGRLELGGCPVMRVWRLHRCPEGQAARDQAAIQREQQARERAESHQSALW